MSLLSSWSRWQLATAAFLDGEPEDEHELPLWRHDRVAQMASPGSASPSPPPPVLPPPPVAASIHASTARLRQNRALPDHLVVLRRREKQLHDDLQLLLYQQDEALRAAAQGTDDAGLSGSTTPTVHTLAGETRSPGSQRRPNVGAGNTRKSIRSAMRQLAAVKAEETRFLDHVRTGNGDVLQKLAGWAEQREALARHIRETEQGDEGARARSLRNEALVLEGEIREVEEKLRAMKARHRKMLSDIAEVENSVQSKLSSYKASLSILDADIQAFLRSPPPDRQAREAPFFRLPPKRRTLELAKDHFEEEQANIDKMRKESETERQALEQGAVMWSDVVHKITDFEKHIAEATRHQDSSADPTAEAKDLIAHLDETINHIESQIELAEERDWKLLVACIGAELSALHEGRRLLEAMLQAAGHVSPTIEREKLLGDVDVEFQPSSLANSQTLQNSQSARSAGAKQAPTRQGRREYNHSTDEDEPDPELLISHQDTDDDENLG